MGVSAQEYQKKLQSEMKRAGSSRDEAVRRTNIATGYGSSTALKHRAGGGEAPAKAASGGGKAKSGGGRKVDRTKTSSTGRSPFKLPEQAPVPEARPPQNAPIGSIAGPQNAPIGSIAGPQNAPIGSTMPPAAPPSFQAPPNANMFQGSQLQTTPPELLMPQGPGQPGPDIGLGMQNQTQPMPVGQPGPDIGLGMQPTAQQLARQRAVSSLFGGNSLLDRSPYKLPTLW